MGSKKKIEIKSTDEENSDSTEEDEEEIKTEKEVKISKNSVKNSKKAGEVGLDENILNSSAIDFVDPVAAYEATNDNSTETTSNIVQALSTENESQDSGQRRKSSRIRHNMIIEAENQLKRQQEM